jgi:hypothetical protein
MRHFVRRRPGQPYRPEVDPEVAAAARQAQVRPGEVRYAAELRLPAAFGAPAAAGREQGGQRQEPDEDRIAAIRVRAEWNVSSGTTGTPAADYTSRICPANAGAERIAPLTLNWTM